MAFPAKKRDMDPPAPPDKKKGLMIAIGIGKPKMKPPSPPPDDDDDDDTSNNGGVPDGGSDNGNGGSDATVAVATPADGQSSAGAGDSNGDAADPRKMEKAGIIRADHHCQNCENWEADTGNCTVLGPGFAPDDACLRYFEELGDDQGENGGTGDMGADMSGGAAAPAGM